MERVMKKSVFTSLVLTLMLVCCAIMFSACGATSVGGVTLKDYQAEGSSTVDISAANLKIESVKAEEGVDYSIKVTGTAKAASEAGLKFAGFPEGELKDNVIVPLFIELSKEILADKDATYTGKKAGVWKDAQKLQGDERILDTETGLYILVTTKNATDFKITYTKEGAEKATEVVYHVDATAVTLEKASE